MEITIKVDKKPFIEEEKSKFYERVDGFLRIFGGSMPDDFVEPKEEVDVQFEKKLRRLDTRLKYVDSPEEADYIILTTLRDLGDEEAEAKIKYYQETLHLGGY